MTDLTDDSEITHAPPAAVHILEEIQENGDPPLPPPTEALETGETIGDSDTNFPTGFRLWAIMAALASSLACTGLDNSILATAIPSITDDFKTVSDIGLYVSVFRLTSCAFQFFWGKLYTLFSIKIVFLCALAIFEGGSLLCAVAPTSHILVLGRAMAGLGTAGILSRFFTIVTHTVPLRRRSIFGGAGAAIEELAAVGAPLLGGVLTDKASWRACFYINLPLGALAFVVVVTLFQNPKVDRDTTLTLKEKFWKIDLLGTVIFVPSMASLLLVLQWGGSKYGWANARIISLIAFFLVLLSLFAYLQYRRQDEATIPPRILMQRSMLSGMWFSFCTNAALAVVVTYLPTYFQTVLNASATKSGALLLPSIVGLMVSVLLGGFATSIIGFYTPLMLLTSILASIGAGLLTTLELDTGLAALIVFQALLGFGVGIGIQGPQVAAQVLLSPKEAPLGTAIVQFGQGMGPAIFVSVAQSIFTARLKADLRKYAPGLNDSAIENMGLSDIKEHLGPVELKGVVLGYGASIAQTFYLPVALSCASLIGSGLMEWRSVKNKTS